MTDAFIAVQVLFLLALSGLLRAMPVLVPPTVPFGVRVPSARADEPVITAATRTYRRGTLACGLVVAFASAATNAFAAGSADTLAATAATSLAALFALSWALYYRAHRSIAAAKAEHAWYQDVPQGVAADLLSQAQHERFPWLWALPAVLVTAATAITGAFRYHQLPASLTTHWNSHGRPAGHAATSLGSAFGPVLLQAAVTAVLLAATVLVLRSTPKLDAEHPMASAAQHRILVRWIARGMVLLALGVDLSLLGTSFMIWTVLRPSGAAMLTVTALPVLATAAVLAIAVLPVRALRAARAAQADDRRTGHGTGLANRDDDRFWRGGVFYLNSEDSAVFVPKRFGIGWTVNLGRPAGWAVLTALLVLPLIAAFISTRLGS